MGAKLIHDHWSLIYVGPAVPYFNFGPIGAKVAFEPKKSSHVDLHI